MNALLVAQQATPPWTPDGSGLFRSLFAFVIVIGLIAFLGWMLKRGRFGLSNARKSGIVIETAVPLGERRSLMVVSVEGRRLLLGLTPSSVALVTELHATPATFDTTLQNTMAPPPVTPR